MEKPVKYSEKLDHTLPLFEKAGQEVFSSCLPHGCEAASRQELGVLSAGKLPLVLEAKSALPHVTVGVRPCRTALNRSSICEYTLNCYGGCLHGCIYCYARYMERFYPHSQPWGQFVDVKVDLLEALHRQLRRLPPGKVFVSSACDGWQPVESILQLTRQAVSLLLDRGFTLRILTKSDLVLRDLPLFADRPVKLGISLSTLDDELARLWEPQASSPSQRLEVIRRASALGIRTGVMIAPVLPGFSDTSEALAALFEQSVEAGAQEICVDSLNLRPKVWESISQLLRRCFPELLSLYRQVLHDSTERRRYLQTLRKQIQRACKLVGMPTAVTICF